MAGEGHSQDWIEKMLLSKMTAVVEVESLNKNLARINGRMNKVDEGIA